jgi:hypothetical protein
VQELQPPIYISGLRIGEPVTAVTDFLVTAVCFYAFYKLRDLPNSNRKYFRLYFLLLGLAVLWGGFAAHAFAYFLSQAWKVPGWLASTWAVSLLAVGMVRQHQNLIAKFSKLIYLIILLELLFVTGATLYSLEFRWAGFHSAFGLLFIVSTLSVWSYFKFRDTGSKLMLIGVGIFILSGLVFTLQLKMHTWFNHVDLTHVFLTVAAYVFYRAIVKMEPLPSSNS